MRNILVTGSSGLIGSEVATFFHNRGFVVHGIDNNQRGIFFGQPGDTCKNLERLKNKLSNFNHHNLDIRNRPAVLELVSELKPHGIVHAAAQTSHDFAAQVPFDDFDINAVGTLNLLEAARRNCPDSPFIFLSTNKVYGDMPNRIPLVEHETRWDYSDPLFINGIDENFGIDQSTHSLFGASKVAADIMVQEYGRYFGIPTCCLRAGCLTGPYHNGVELHGFLSYLVKCNLEQRVYTIYGYKGKQVRDNLHAYDVACFIHAFFESPRIAEIYNLGGGKENSCSVIEAIEIIEKLSGMKQLVTYAERNRIGDHICYYSNLSKVKQHYPCWHVSKPLMNTIEEIFHAWKERLS